LFSDPASECWEADGYAIALQGEAATAPGPCTPDALEACVDVLRVVGSEIGDIELGCESVRADLDDVACSAKRGAILLLVAAWAAERKRPRKASSAPDPQMAFPSSRGA